ncbi:hypothetical protein B0A48_11700 [Cryoendolithus antarcticus]|uniref:BRCT domain-containing protein n=1 Tax=Cryoendolithus antarcticus TaxID=1507870 RepID=A0A1V8ST16_9PEZI|nr:hypothetical protein B0A48_11700 [Cryoendolithus antarcticus]
MLVSLTVGKVDAGVAVLLTDDKRLIEFPSILLPPDIHSGSIVDIDVSRNLLAETAAARYFSTLQSEVLQTFGSRSPSAPVLRCRNATQTSVVLEWDPLELATAELRSLSLYRNGSKAGAIPRDKLSTKISGLALDTEYTFHLVLRTSAGVYSSERLVVKTHTMTNLTGITVTPGVMPGQLRDSLAETVNRIGVKLIDSVRIDTTHFVCTEPRGAAWEKAVELNVPVVVPDWLKGCEREGRLVGVRGYYLDADPKLRQIGTSQLQQQRSSVAVASTPSIEHTPPTPERPTRGERPEVERPVVPMKEEEEEEEEAEGKGSNEEQDGARDGYSIAGTTAVETQDDDEDEERDDESDDTEKAIRQGKRSADSESANGAAGKDVTTDAEAEQIAEEDGKGEFDDVAL